MTLLELITQFCELRGLVVPNTVLGATDAQVIQLKRLVEQSCKQISERGAWEELTREATWTTVATESQGTVASIATDGFRWFIPDTFWDRTNRLPLVGPITGQEWQYLKSNIVTGPRYSFRVRGGELLVSPAPTAGYTWAFEYVSRNFAYNMGQGVRGATFSYDNDEILLPDDILLADLEWRWLKTKGLPYAEEFRLAERSIVAALGRDGGKRILRTDGEPCPSPRPGVFIPAGSWPL